MLRRIYRYAASLKSYSPLTFCPGGWLNSCRMTRSYRIRIATGGCCEAAPWVPVLNVTQDFRKQAEAFLARSQYLYWLDDTHWNADGIHEAAQAITNSNILPECR